MAEEERTPRISRRKFVAWSALAAASASLAPLLQACSPSPAASPTAAPKAAAPTQAAAPAAQPTAAAATGPTLGGILRVTLGSDIKTLDPHKQGSVFDWDVLDQIYEGLVDCDLVEVRGLLAEKWETVDTKSYTFFLKKGVKFHDGSDFTAEAVKFSFDRVGNPATAATPVPKRVQEQVAEVAVVDSHTVKIVLKSASASFPSELTDVRIVPTSFNAEKPVGTGPFQYVEWVRNQKVRVKKFADYHMKGLPYLDEIAFQPAPDEDQKIALLQTGQVDFADTIPLPRVKQVKQDGKIVVIGIPAGVSPSSYWMDCNVNWGPLKDAKVRQALNYAIDRKSILDITFGEGTLKSSLIPPKHWAFNSKALSFDQRDVAKAKQLLAEAGQSSGFTVQLKHLTSRAEFATIAQLIQANLADIGVKVEILPLDVGVWVEQVNKGDFQITLTGLTPMFDPDPLLSRPYKTSGWKNEEFDKLLAQGRAEAKKEERIKIYAKAQEIAQAESPAFVVNERPILYGASPKVQGFKPDLRQHTHFREVWLQK